ncbi:fructosamine kinase family protein [Schaalia vaccimaxillae]|uniref:fructosamine kinase family protein n=1 Tax=Schaalia vaccimaxillae TaxID=183916 RepID=UPI0003B3A981|nr:fructosamine kinase family protein [Schaalia vaccimaxillae]
METFRKTDPRPLRINYEVAGLTWLADAGSDGAAIVPVLDHGRTWLEEPRLERTNPSAQTAQDFGRALAHTHAAGASHLGAPPAGHHGDGWIGQAPLTLPTQPRGTSEPSSWGAFYASERILPYVNCPAFSTSDRALIRDFCERLASGDFDHPQPALVRAHINEGEVGAARTHGDLWSGNVMWTPKGVVLIDPAAQGGHAEEDLAALAVFGCPMLEQILAAYNEESPLADGWRERVTLHQLHIMMIHAYLFGRSYAGDVLQIVRRYS